MITLHALQYSRALRVSWLLADLGQPCNRVDYDRTADFHAPDSLSRVHPLGKSPVIEDEGEVIAESATILRYLAAKFDDTTHSPPPGSAAYWHHAALLDYVESSFAEVAAGGIMPAFRGDPVPQDASDAIDRHLAYLAQALGDGPLLFGDRAMLADIQFSYIIAMLDRVGLLKNHPRIAAYWDALQQQPGYIAAVDAAGPMAPPA
ncbi:glutathione S-transferase family protein [Loktanella sp. TSTF-M6]|uniref:Glutathione S-transferase family protein n=1 Tax=Loktanella gaetbuli TaxID=2881335 RepID=A0ABS8BS77_9RHOB|nr:glutathione S-transferase family protein [Loktanella gaetbuli]MCB5198434.1 glutathione S-transferase family protein [Loktanella gaetbuli]